jgi:16S rRNA (cytidine1402-2'-O)-methyltransferase
LFSYNDFNGDRVRPKILSLLSSNKAVAYASDAGMPLIADPGYQLSKQAAERGFYVTSVPGASACLTALSLSGLPTDRFFFEGFLPVSAEKRREKLKELAQIPSTLIFYESPKRLTKVFNDLIAIMGENRRAVIARELTKKFEQIISGTLGELYALTQKENLKGELVVLLDRPLSTSLTDTDIRAQLSVVLDKMSLKDASNFVAAAHGLSKRYVYSLALSIRDVSEEK